MTTHPTPGTADRSTDPFEINLLRATRRPGTGHGEALAIMRGHHARLLGLCERLEGIADSLPDQLDVGECLGVARLLPPTVATSHGFEEETFFPLARRLLADAPRLDQAIERLILDHREDEGYAAEAAEALTALALDWRASTDRQSTEATGYLLRGLFETLRRHIAFENAIMVAPLADRIQER